jgi:hypothetical protein
MSVIQQIKQIFSQPDPDEVIAFQYKVPRSITVEVVKEGDYLIGRVEKINDEALDNATFITEAKTMTELVIEINDMLYTYLDFPENIKTRMPRLLPPEMAAQELKRSSHKELVFAK